MQPDEWTDQLTAFLDGDLDPVEHARCEEHVAYCPSCQAALDDMRRITAAAAALPDAPPTRDLWPGVAARIGRPAAVIPFRRRPGRLAVALAAGFAMVAVSAGALWMATRPGSQGTPGHGIAAAADAPPAILPVRLASTDSIERTADAAVADLRGVLAAQRESLDSTTVAVLERNLAIIDSAIADAEAALRRDPGDAYLNTHLARTMRRKIDILRQAALLSRSST